ncbi:polynucleotide phosphorylase/polyadenylase [Candidatus Magnetomorum sp. HK-1]|nr:polynucleotide phosphorylase/polyadenylase [Candidatus Magnetomorum sp. HK-1]
MELELKAEIGGRTLSVRTGKMAKQASGAVLVQYGETQVLVTVVASNDLRTGIDFVPLSVEYQEKIYAAGRIPGNYFRREVGRPSEKETLTARLIDRPIRPLLPKHFRYETQVIATVLSMDQENDPDTLSMIGASAAMSISDIPFASPIACVRVARLDGRFVINPNINKLHLCDINMMVARSKEGIVMVEGEGQIVSEQEIVEAIFFANDAMQPIIDLQEKLREVAGVEKRVIVEEKLDDALLERIKSIALEPTKNALTIADKKGRHKTLYNIKNDVLETLGEEYADQSLKISNALHDIQRDFLRNMILDEGRRIDNRKLDEIRTISTEVGVLARPHGSALFTRGETQVLGVLTLGSSSDEQRVETLSGDEFRPFMLHYNFPPYSVGEVKRVGAPSRRDIGHGGLSTRAINKVLPPKDRFDYTIRIVSEVLESNGSSSMGTVCAASLALMDGGVPITDAVSGIAMGLIKEGDKVVILSDILGDEDHMGDMDFKVAGTKDGITSVQMDIKIHGISREILEKALDQAKEGRLFILGKMMETIKSSRTELSPYAPCVLSLNIKPDKIRDVIGPGGKVIRSIQSETNCKVDIDDSGTVRVSALSEEEANVALNRIKEIVTDPEVGAIYSGEVVRITDFGAFVRILPGTEGLVHISQLEHRRVARVRDVVKEGDIIPVKVIEIGRDGKIRLSKKAANNDDEPINSQKHSRKRDTSRY